MRHSILLALPLAACSSVPLDPEPDFQRVRQLAATATGLDTSGIDPWAPRADPADLLELAEGGLTLAEVQTFALRHDPTLQTALLEVGIAHADWVQAQRLTNPAFDLLLRLPSGGGRALLELVVSMNLLELWQVPLREEREEHRVRAAVLVAARRAGELTGHVRDAYHGLLVAREELDLAAEELALAESLHASVLALRAAGAADAMDEALAGLQLLEAGTSTRAAVAGEARAERALMGLLALERPPTSLGLADPLPSPPAASSGGPSTCEQLVTRALESRADLVALRETVDALAAQVKVTSAESWGELTAGPAAERSSEGTTSVGAELTWDPPIFDDGDAAKAAAELRRDQAERLLRAARIQVARDVRDASARLDAAGVELSVHEQETLNLAEHSLGLAQAVYDAGELELRDLILAQGELLSARRDRLRLRTEAAASLVQLERAVGGPVEFTDQ